MKASQLAKDIVDGLMTGGFGKRAEIMIMELSDGVYDGGLDRASAERNVARTLRRILSID